MTEKFQKNSDRNPESYCIRFRLKSAYSPLLIEFLNITKFFFRISRCLWNSSRIKRNGCLLFFNLFSWTFVCELAAEVFKGQ